MTLGDYATWNSVKLSFGGFRKIPRASCLVPRVVAGALKIARQRLFILKLNGCPTAEQRDTFTQVESSRAYCIRQQEISPWLHLPLPPSLLFYFRQLRRFLFGASLFIPDSHLVHNFMAFLDSAAARETDVTWYIALSRSGKVKDKKKPNENRKLIPQRR